MEQYLIYPLRFLALAGATISLLSLDVHAQAITNWRSLARGARANLASQNYVAAEKGYAQALDMLRIQDAKAEAIYDLQLLLVETYRRGGQYGKADELLNNIEPAVMRGKFADPTIAVRFWRRRADLRCSQKRMSEGIACLKKAIAILEKHFQTNSGTMLNNYTVLLKLACEQEDWQTIADVLGRLRVEKRDNEVAKKLSPGERNQLASLNQARLIALSLVSARASKLVEVEDYPRAMMLFRLLAEAGDEESAVRTLLAAMAKYNSAKQYSKVDAIVPVLNNVLDKLDASNKQNISLKIAGHADLAGISELRGQGESQLAEWKKVYELFEKQGKNCSFIDMYHGSHARNRIATLSEFKPEGATDRALDLISASVKATVLPTAMRLSGPDARAMRVMHLDSRICYSWAYQTRKDWKKSEEVLDSIDPLSYAEQIDAMKLNVVGQRITAAGGYAANGNSAGYQRNMAIAKAMLVKIPTSPLRTKFLELAQSVEREAGSKMSKAMTEGASAK